MRSTAERAPNDPRVNEYFKRGKKSAGNSPRPEVSPLLSLLPPPLHPPVPVSPFPARWPGAWLFSAAAPNAAPRAPYQRCNTNSWEQLSGGFNSSPTTRGKGKKTRNHERLPNGSGFKRTIPPSQSVCLCRFGPPTTSLPRWNH